MKVTNLLSKMLLGFATLLLSVSMFAQTVNISGTVVDNNGLPVIGASVMVAGTTTGAATDIDGKYTLNNVASNATLNFSAIGYASVSVVVNGRSVIDAVLAEEAESLDETIVVGYAVGNKRSVSGAVERVTAEQMNQGLISNPIEALQGKVPGLVITQNGGSVLGNPTVRVRGTSSLSGGSDPLVVIDGIFSDMATFQSLPVNDIKEISLLKDASETAQYGSRGSNGVILVITNRGEEGKVSVDYNGQFGVSTAYKDFAVLTGKEWVETSNKYFNGVGNNLGYDTNWAEFVQNKFVYQNNHSLSFSQGTSKSNMRASIGYNDRQGTLKGAQNTTYNMSFSASTKAFDNKLVFELGARMNRNLRNNPSYSWSSALQYNPTYPTFRNPETGMWDKDPGASFLTNPGESGESIRKSEGNRIMVNGRVTWNIIEGLQLSASGSYTSNTNLNKNYTPNDLSSTYATAAPGTASLSSSFNSNMMGNIQLSYIKKIGKSEINALALAEAQSYKNFSYNASSSGYGTNKFLWNNLQAGATVVKSDVGSSASDNRILSYMARFNYMYDNRYVATINVRTDGSSKLGTNYKWGFFPSASLAWVASNEEFMKEWGAFSTLKFRLGYGVTGNQNNISAYQSMQTMTPAGTTEYAGKVYTTYNIASNPNPDLKWETKATLDFGIDFSTLKSRLRGTFDWYKSNTKDLLYTYQVPAPPFVYGTLLANMGEMENKGIELALTGDIVKTKDWAFTLAGNFASSKNTLVSLHGTYQGQELSTSEYVSLATIGGQGLTQNNEGTIMKEGYPVSLFYLPRHAGFAGEKGSYTYTYKDLDGDGTVLPTVGNDREICGQVMPKWTANLSFTLRYKSFDLQGQAQGAFGHMIFNQAEMNMSDLGQFPAYNISPKAVERGIIGKAATDYWLEKGDYVNISYISLGYNVPTRGLKNIQSCRVALSCNNVGTITKYSGMTPMIDSQSLNGGIDNNVDPIMRTYALQLTLKF